MRSLQKMPNRSRILQVGSFLLLPCLLAEAQQKPASSQTSSDTNPKPPAAKSAAAPNPTSAPKASAPARRRPVRRSAAPVRELRPTKERYTEIQQSLAKAGYFSEPANGVWGDSSVRALQEFQGAQGLQPTGKIDAPTLIRLGLGPNYDSPQETASSGAASPR
jgi:peptidoglycan hydrolase-like protein with peptidoglycan-binding domain